MPFLIINKMFKIKGDLIELIFSCIIILLTITLIILIISLTIKKPKVLSEYKVKIKTIIGLESLDFIDNISIPEYPHANLGLTGKLILDCYTGTCIKEIIWYETSGFKLFRKIKRLPLEEISNIYIGINSSKLFEKFNIPLSNDQQCMSIFCENGKILALQNDNEATTKTWYYALNYLINHNKMYGNGQQILNEENIKYYY